MQFVRDFLFTDINNHLELIQFIQNLGKDDDVLLISLLERLADSHEPLVLVAPFSTLAASRYRAVSHRQSPLLSLAATPRQYGSICAPPPDAATNSAGLISLNSSNDANNDRRMLLCRTVSHIPSTECIKRPLRIANGYAALRSLHDHQYNVYKYAYLVSSAPPSADVSKRVGFMAIFAFITQLTFFLVLSSYNIVEKEVCIDPKEDFFAEVVFIMIASTTMFGLTLSLQYVNASRFNSSMIFLREENANKIRRREQSRLKIRSLSTYIYAQTLNRPKFYLTMNIFINLVVGLCIFFFKRVFHLDRKRLNLCCMELKIDEVFKPKWTESKVQCLLAELLMDYCLAKALLEYAEDEDDWQEEVTVERRMGPSIDGPVVKLYVHLFNGIWTRDELDENEEAFRINVASGSLRTRTPSKSGQADDDWFSVVVYSSAQDDQLSTTISYNRTVYDVKGPRAGELYEAFSKFHCLKNFHALHIHQPHSIGHLHRSNLPGHHRAVTTTTWFG
jgi:hypothetical protein